VTGFRSSSLDCLGPLSLDTFAQPVGEIAFLESDHLSRAETRSLFGGRRSGRNLGSRIGYLTTLRTPLGVWRRSFKFLAPTWHSPWSVVDEEVRGAKGPRSVVSPVPHKEHADRLRLFRSRVLIRAVE
jgi:hypothetical protein